MSARLATESVISIAQNMSQHRVLRSIEVSVLTCPLWLHHFQTPEPTLNASPSSLCRIVRVSAA